MKTCVGCQYAEWKRTKAGRLHPSGEGLCAFQYKVPVPPAAFYFAGGGVPIPNGGYIERHKGLDRDCIYYQGKRLDHYVREEIYQTINRERDEKG